MSLKGSRSGRTCRRTCATCHRLEVFTHALTLGSGAPVRRGRIWGFRPLATTILLASGLLKKLNQARNELSEANEQLQGPIARAAHLNTIGREISTSLDAGGRLRPGEPARAEDPRRAPPVPVAVPPHSARVVRRVRRARRRGPAASRARARQGFTSWVVEAKRPLLGARPPGRPGTRSSAPR